jgi:hypothetical protein
MGEPGARRNRDPVPGETGTLVPGETGTWYPEKPGPGYQGAGRQPSGAAGAGRGE